MLKYSIKCTNFLVLQFYINEWKLHHCIKRGCVNILNNIMPHLDAQLLFSTKAENLWNLPRMQ